MIRACLKKYRDGGLKAVYEYEKHKHESELERFVELIEKELEKRPPRSATEAGGVIEKPTGIKRSPTRVRAFPKKEIRRLKTGGVPCKADPAAQKEFMKTTTEPVISSAKRGEIELYHVDACP